MIVALNFIALPDTQAAGAFRYISRLIQMMQYYELSDVEFHIYKQIQIPESFFQIPLNLKVTFIDVPTLGRGMKRIIFEQTLFYKYIKPCDVFYSYCMSIPLLIGTRKIFTLHDVFGYSTSERYGFLRRMYIRLTTRIYVYMADEILTVSSYSKQEIQHYLHVPDNRLTITYNFLLPNEIPHFTNSSLYNKKPYFLFVGSLLPHKNIIGMANGFVKFNSEKAYELKIVGKPVGNQEAMISHIQELDNIQLLGYQTDDVISKLYQNCIGVVLLSYCEGFGIPPLEGFNYGKPALVSNTASLPEVVGAAGIKVDPYDIDAIAKGYEELVRSQEELKQHIQTQLDRFNPYHSCEHFMDVLGINYKRL